MAIANDKLRKVSDRLYEEDWEEGKEPLKWEKQFDELHMRLTEVVAEEGFLLGIKGATLTDENSTDDITNAQFEPNRTVRLINPEEGDKERFWQAEVLIAPTTEWNESAEGPTIAERYFKGSDDEQKDEQKSWDPTMAATSPGFLQHNPDLPEPNLSLILFVPEATFTPTWERLISGLNVGQAELSIAVEVFRPEAYRALSMPDDYQEYYIERDGINHFAFPSRFSIRTPTAVARSSNTLEDQWNDDTEEAESKQFNGSNVVNLLKSVRTALYIITGLLAIAVVALIF